ncbi:Glycerol 2-dehydrogenase (NADP(+)) [Cyphellophora attinorum]|uniref:D-xylose reductase [NAD(P)H] n=1 Tax=Cyphellophora attinorum TaxID=1664694 RepID=A0A0N1H7W0_9EURO|nr:Glycerol 2-dehydrogenase (NADP(+)) [Phialophora attinorum]KPI39253.1 Glycerol 2-dehydrogenase (NADP(+)) [Phialophora attinorum]
MASSARPEVCTKRFPLNIRSQSTTKPTIPAVGLGTWQGQFGTDATTSLKNSIIHALHSGYRLIDTAQSYGVESVVGAAIRESGVPRDEITVISKLWGTSFHDVPGALERSLRDLDVGYIDLYLMHWPNPMGKHGEVQAYPGSPPFWEVWKSLERCVDGEKLRGIGVSNFTQKTLGVLFEKGVEIAPAVNEVELHVLNPNFELVKYCEEKGIQVVSWSTMGGERLGTGKNPILEDGELREIAKRYGVSTGVLSLSWAVQRGIVVIPKSSKHERIEENVRLVTLEEGDMAKMNNAGGRIGKMRIADAIEGIHYKVDGRNTLMGWSKVDMGWEDKEGNWLV